MPLFQTLSPEAQTLVALAEEHLRAGYDPVTGIVTETLEGAPYRSVRNSMYYALALLLRHGKNEVQTAEHIIRAVLSLQFHDPDQIYYGTFRHPDDPMPPELPGNYHAISPEARYLADLTWERVSASFAEALGETQSDTVVSQAADVLQRTLRRTVPVVWDTYEPNLREFIGMTLAMLLRHFSDLLSQDLVDQMEMSCIALLEGAISRLDAELTPYNTNVRIMVIFLLDFFGGYFRNSHYAERAWEEMHRLMADYEEFHAVAEFNSPTYCGVDLSTLGFFRRYSTDPDLIEMADHLEDGIWHDMAAFYNPDMRAFCGPYSRCYELDMSIHTCFYDLLYLGLGASRFPDHPFSIESVINPLHILGDIRIPEDVQAIFLGHTQDRTVVRQYRELAERGDPTTSQAVCTASAVIHPDLMYGAMAGSLNPSHQLHPFVLFWRTAKGLGTIKLMRSLTDGTLGHLHVVRFNGTAEEGCVTMEVSNDSLHPILLRFEVELPEGLCESDCRITEDRWELPGLTLSLAEHFGGMHIRHVEGSTFAVCYPVHCGENARFLIEMARK